MRSPWFWVVLLLSFAVDIGLWKQSQARILQQNEARFKRQVDDFRVSLLARLQSQELVLRGGVGLHAAHDSLDRESWKSYIHALQLDQHQPGILGVGFAMNIKPGEEADLENRIRKEGYPGFRVWPDSHGQERTPVVFLEPFEGRNLRALGYDLSSEPMRRRALERARDSGEPVLTARVRLVQENPADRSRKAGFLMCLPIYRTGLPTNTVEDRRRAIEGYVYSPFRMEDFIFEVQPNLERNRVGLEVYDGTTLDPDSLLFRTQNFNQAASASPGLSLVENLPLYGHDWTLHFTATPTFQVEGGSNRPDLILFLGAAISVLTAGGLLILLTTRLRARRLAEEMTSELRGFQENLEKLVAQRTRELREANLELGSEMERRANREEQLRQAQKMEAVGRLAGGVAHDFNNLLTAINGYTALCLDMVGEDSPLRPNLEEIRRAGEMAASLTRQLLAYSRKQILSFRMVSLNEAVGDMGRMIQRLIGGEIAVDLRLSPETGRVKVDPAQLQQALINLALNARDAMPDGGQLTIETGVLELAEADTGGLVGEAAKSGDGAIPPGRYAVLTVRDTGQGMDEAVKSRLFEPYFTTKQMGHDKGTGLGLSMVYGIVKQSGGYIQVYSAPSMGAEFRIILPECRDTAAVGIEERTTRGNA